MWLVQYVTLPQAPSDETMPRMYSIHGQCFPFVLTTIYLLVGISQQLLLDTGGVITPELVSAWGFQRVNIASYPTIKS